MIIIILIINSCGKQENRSLCHLEHARELIVETSIYTYTLDGYLAMKYIEFIRLKNRDIDNDVLSKRNCVFRFIAFH